MAVPPPATAGELVSVKKCCYLYFMLLYVLGFLINHGRQFSKRQPSFIVKTERRRGWRKLACFSQHQQHQNPSWSLKALLDFASHWQLLLLLLNVDTNWLYCSLNSHLAFYWLAPTDWLSICACLTWWNWNFSSLLIIIFMLIFNL